MIRWLKAFLKAFLKHLASIPADYRLMDMNSRKRKRKRKGVSEALRGDWVRLGGDMRKVISKFKKENNID